MLPPVAAPNLLAQYLATPLSIPVSTANISNAAAHARVAVSNESKEEGESQNGWVDPAALAAALAAIASNKAKVASNTSLLTSDLGNLANGTNGAAPEAVMVSGAELLAPPAVAAAARAIEAAARSGSLSLSRGTVTASAATTADSASAAEPTSDSAPASSQSDSTVSAVNASVIEALPSDTVPPLLHFAAYLLEAEARNDSNAASIGSSYGLHHTAEGESTEDSDWRSATAAACGGALAALAAAPTGEAELDTLSNSPSAAVRRSHHAAAAAASAAKAAVPPMASLSPSAARRSLTGGIGGIGGGGGGGGDAEGEWRRFDSTNSSTSALSTAATAVMHGGGDSTATMAEAGGRDREWYEDEHPLFSLFPAPPHVPPNWHSGDISADSATSAIASTASARSHAAVSSDTPAAGALGPSFAFSRLALGADLPTAENALKAINANALSAQEAADLAHSIANSDIYTDSPSANVTTNAATATAKALPKTAETDSKPATASTAAKATTAAVAGDRKPAPPAVALAVGSALARYAAAASRARTLSTASAVGLAALTAWSGAATVAPQLAAHPLHRPVAAAAAAAAAPASAGVPQGMEAWAERRRRAAAEAAVADSATGANAFLPLLQEWGIGSVMSRAIPLGDDADAAAAAEAVAGVAAGGAGGGGGGVTSTTSASLGTTGTVVGAWAANVSQTGLMSPLQATLVKLSKG